MLFDLQVIVLLIVTHLLQKSIEIFLNPYKSLEIWR